MALKVLGVGLSKTGTTSLDMALRILGFSCIHRDMVRLNDILDGSNRNPDFRCYDDVDAVTDIPSAAFYREILQTYQDCKAILTIRDINAWWPSMLAHLQRRRLPRLDPRHPLLDANENTRDRRNVVELMQLNRSFVYGWPEPHEVFYKKKYLEHNERVRVEVPMNRLLVMDITAGDGWEVLCPFLDLTVPRLPFPHANIGSSASTAPAGELERTSTHQGA